MVAGQSMGGTIALHLAATDLRVRAVASLAAPIWVRNWQLPLLPVIKRLRRWHIPGGGIDLYHPEAVQELYSYGMRSTRAIHEFVRLLAHARAELAQVRAPVLLLHGERDRTIDPRNASDIAAGLICSTEVELHLYPRSGHALSVDVDREDVNARVLAWCDRHSSSR
jgi:esterase/lipase